jgi:hypothetical protein
VLRGFGLKVGAISRGRFDARIRQLVNGQAMLETVIDSMLVARAALQQEFARLHRTMLAVVREDPVCRQLMSVPGVGAVVAVTFKSGVDNPTRFRRSRDVGPHFGLTPRKYQSGELDVTGSITKVGDRDGADGAVRGSERDADPCRAHVAAQELGDGRGEAARWEEGTRRPGAQARRHPPPDVDRRHELPLE